MTNPSTRLLTVLHLLHLRPMNSQELAQRLEVDTRTIRRYIMQLRDLGIPIESQMGSDAYYQLPSRQKLPPSIFSQAELQLMAHILGQVEEDSAAASLREKIKRLLCG